MKPCREASIAAKPSLDSMLSSRPVRSQLLQGPKMPHLHRQLPWSVHSRRLTRSVCAGSRLWMEAGWVEFCGLAAWEDS